ncbi:TetR/AcrR family transcriptional regulator [Marinilactibacillus psychrotolerans]|uniref:TetR/AcrR family transcriptional regulator n=1 Tax=Marinilactibacillus psychrotolerans TaxID=191770 RepID=UPI0038894529
MNEGFNKLSLEKQNIILNAAYKEFTENGYEKASTNIIAKNGEIGKGTLFYYFGNKRKLFDFLINTSFQLTYEEYFNKIDFDQTDFFKRLVEVSQLKQQVYKKYQAPMGFISKILINTGEFDLSEEQIKKRAIVEETWAQVLKKNIDFSKFREDLPQEITFNFIRWTLEGYRQELELRVKQNEDFLMDEENIKTYYDEYFSYIKMLKKIYYKNNLD